jgi:hypothetical protein
LQAFCFADFPVCLIYEQKYFSLVAVPLVVAATFLTNISQSFADLPPLIPRQILFGNPERTNPHYLLMENT